MSGLYIHIPFCRKRCNYCDFYKESSLQDKKVVLEAIHEELRIRQDYLEEPLQTIYFGGGTPSVLSYDDIYRMFDVIHKYYTVLPDAEISFEANPDDLIQDYLISLQKTPINRLSLGIQSFDDEVLQLMNRRHTGLEAMQTIQRIRDCGFDNLSLDLIYGVPNTDVDYLIENLEKLTNFTPEHISAYHLTIEEGTVFQKMKDRKKIYEIADRQSELQYETLVAFLNKKGYDQYEISNFSRDGKISQHNTNYWMQKPYLGVGASAHSYNGTHRQWNISNTRQYTKSIFSGEIPLEEEELSIDDKFNDYIMVRLRTKWGVNVEYLERSIGKKYREYFIDFVEKNKQYFEEDGASVRIKQRAFLQADYLIRKIFVI